MAKKVSRRNKALIALFVPIVAGGIVQYFYPPFYTLLLGYVAALVLLFKSAILSLWLASKLKIIAFLKSLTLTQTLLLTFKRWIIDNVLSKWIKKNILSHLSEAIAEMKRYFSLLSFRAKVKNSLLFILPLGLVTWLIYLGDMLSSLALTAELKLLVSGFFKALWLLVAQFGLFVSELSQSWLAPLLELFALSFLLEWIERKFGKNNPLTRFFNTIGNLLNSMLEKIGLLHEKHIEPQIQKRVVSQSQKLSRKILEFIKSRKISQEYLYFDNLQNMLLRGHIDAYHRFDDMHAVTDKKRLYRRINEATQDNIEIKAFVSRNSEGALMEEHVPDDFYHDLFILEGIASSQAHGVREENEETIDHSDFWVLNTSRYPVTLTSQSGNFKTVRIDGKDMQLVKCRRKIPYTKRDIFAGYQGKEVSVTPL